MSKLKFKLKRAEVRKLLKSDEMKGVLLEFADHVADRAGDGYEQDIYVGKNRANAMVRASTYQAKKDNLKNNTLLKALNK